MSGNRRTNKKQNRLSFLGFFLLFLLSMGLVAYATYNTFYYIPEEANRVEGVRALSDKERQEATDQINTQLDSIFNTLSSLNKTGKYDLGRWQNLNMGLQALVIDFEKDASSLGIQSKAFQEIIFLAVEMDRKIRKQQEDLDDKVKELKECEKDMDKMRQDMNDLRQAASSN